MRFLAMLLVATATTTPHDVPRPQRRVSPTTTPNYLMAPFVAPPESLPPAFKGNDLAMILSALGKRALDLKKSEFETGDEYLTRVQNLRSAPVIGTIHIGDTLAIAIPARSAEYYGEDGMFRIKILSEKDTGKHYWGENKPPLFCKVLNVSYREYIGQNAFGASMLVRAATTDQGCVSLPSRIARFESGSASANDDKSFVFWIKLPPERARNVKDRLTLLFIGVLANDLVGTDSSHFTPTLELPVDSTTSSRWINFDLGEVWVFDEATGEVFLRAKTMPAPNG